MSDAWDPKVFERRARVGTSSACPAIGEQLRSMFTAIAAESTPPGLIALAEALDAAFQRGDLGGPRPASGAAAESNHSKASD